MKRIVALFGLACLACMLSGCGGAEAEEETPADVRGPELKSTSVALDPTHITEFLSKMVKLVDDGIDRAQSRQVLSVVNGMSAGEVKTLDLPIVFQQQRITMEVQIFFDDPRHVEIYFFTPPALSDQIAVLAEDFTAALASPQSSAANDRPEADAF